MSDNPYQSPAPDFKPPVVGVLSGRREDLRRVAFYQKGIVACIAINFLLYFLAIVMRVALPPELGIFLGLGMIAVGLAGTVFVFLLATKVYHPAIGILLGIITLIPCIGLLALLVVNGKATSILTQNGIRVGLMGADLGKI